MNIKQVINLWQQSKYNKLILTTLPVINHQGEITQGTGIYTKGEHISFGKVYTIEEYLQHIHKDSIYMLDSIEHGYLSFKEIYRKEVR